MYDYFEDDRLYEDHRFSTASRPRAQKLYYVFLRTKLAVANDLEAGRTLQSFLEEGAEIVSDASGRTPYIDGFVLRVWSKKASVEELISSWTGHLQRFDAWAIHDGGTLAESYLNGPATAAMKHVGNAVSRQAFLICSPEERASQDPDSAAERIMSCWREPSKSSFYFKNGRALFIAGDTPATILQSRLSSIFPRIPTRRHSRLTRREFAELMIEGDNTHESQTYYGECVGWTKLITTTASSSWGP